MNEHGKVVSWGYFTELALVGLLTAFFARLFAVDVLARFFMDTSGAWVAYVGIAFAATLAMWVALFQVGSTAFGQWLLIRGALAVYSRSFGYSVAVCSITTVVFIAATSQLFKGVAIFSLLSLFFLLYTSLTLFTSCQTVHGLLVLWAEFQKRSTENGADVNVAPKDGVNIDGEIPRPPEHEIDPPIIRRTREDESQK